MSRQRDILPQVLRVILQQVPDAAVYLSGSVSFGYERPESDMDIIVAVSDLTPTQFPGGKVTSQTDQTKVFDATLDGVRLDIVFATQEFFEQQLVQKPWRGYYFTQLEVVHDPGGFIRSAQDRIRPWFDSHDNIVGLWKKWMTERRTRALTNRREQGDLIKRFPDIFALWKHLDPMFEKEESPNQAIEATSQ